MITAVNRQKTIRFRRFLRKAYAVFCSLHKEISIGFLSVDTNNSSLKTLKKKIVEIFFEDNTETSEKQEFFELIKTENTIFTPALQAVFVVSKDSFFERKLHKKHKLTQIFYFINKSLRFFYLHLLARVCSPCLIHLGTDYKSAPAEYLAMTTNAVRHCERSEAIQIKKYNINSYKHLKQITKSPNHQINK
ncbi:MAG: hypothetical protein LBN95_13420 [Prevotellaceae bacterium]|jgi:hypothetical protein|nr:hypothetical protein [Prevotellaceae bacterium]